MMSSAVEPLEAQPLWRHPLAPAFVSAGLIAWTLVVSPFSDYGDTWAILPAVLALPVVLLWHVALGVLLRGRRRSVILVALAHILVLVPVWVLCLVAISKDGP
jgi:hypothetical protein